MKPRPRRSRKRSVASSTARRLESAVVYLDQSIFSHILLRALQDVGVEVRRPGIDVPYDTPDEEWLARAGEQGWIVLMRDQRVRYRPLELQALRAARVGAFVVTAGQATAQQTAEVVLKKLKAMVNIASSERRPFLYAVSLMGTLSRVALKPV